MNIFRPQYSASHAQIPAVTHNTQPAGEPPSLEKLRILVVEDDAASRQMIVDTLSTFGAIVTPVSTADRALMVAARQQFDLLLSDIGLPDHDGITLIQKLRLHGVKIPAMALTAYGREEDLEHVLDAGFDMYMQKPIEMAYLLAAVSDLMSRAKEPEDEFDLKSKLK